MTLDRRLLQALREAAVHLPANELAAQLGESAVAVRSRMHALRAAGFDIEERPGLGFRLIASPDRLIADDLAARLGACPLAREIVVFAETGSTNDLVLQRGREGTEAGLVVFAERQTAGRGRFGRRWESTARRGLWFSLLVRPELPLARWPRLTTWAAVSIAAAVENATGRRAAIKWPNDVFLHEKKVAGILIETGTDAAGGQFATVGIGVNVNHDFADFPPELADRATSLRAVTGRRFDRTAFAVALLAELDAHWERLAGGFPELVAEASSRSLLLGRWVQLRSGDHLREGLAERLDEDGQLVVRDASGAAEALIAGEITVVGGVS